MIIENKYVVIIHETNEYHISKFFESAMIETTQEMIVESELEKIDINKFPKLKEGEYPEKDKIYNIDDKAIKKIITK